MTDSTTFTAAGHDWTINWTMATSRRLAAIGVNASNAVHIENLLNLFNDRYKQVDAIWTCIAGKAAELGVTKEQFEESLGGNEIESAFNAIVASFIQWNVVDVRSALREAVTEFHRGVKQAADEFIAEMNAPPASTPEPAVA